MASSEAGPSRHTVHGEDSARVSASAPQRRRLDTPGSSGGEWFPSPGRAETNVARSHGRARLSRRDKRAQRCLESAYLNSERTELERAERANASDGGPGLGAALMESVVNAGVMGAAVGLTAYKLWTEGWDAIRGVESGDTTRKVRRRRRRGTSLAARDSSKSGFGDWRHRRRRRPRRPSITALSRAARLSPASTGLTAWTKTTTRTGTASASASGWDTSATTPTTGARATHRRFASAVSPDFCNYAPVNGTRGQSPSASCGLGRGHIDPLGAERLTRDTADDALSSGTDTDVDETSARLGAMARRVDGLIRSGRAALSTPITTPEPKPLREAIRDASVEKPMSSASTPRGRQPSEDNESDNLVAQAASSTPTKSLSADREHARTLGLGPPPLSRSNGAEVNSTAAENASQNDGDGEVSENGRSEPMGNATAAPHMPSAALAAPRSVSAPLRPSALPRPAVRALSTSRARYEQVTPPLPWRRQNGTSRWVQAPVSPVKAAYDTSHERSPVENVPLVSPPVPPPPAVYARPATGQVVETPPEPRSPLSPRSPVSPSSRIPRPSSRARTELPYPSSFPSAASTPSSQPTTPPNPLQEAAHDAAQWHSVRGSPAPMPGLVASRASLFAASASNTPSIAPGNGARSRIPVRNNMGSISSLSSVE